MERGCFKICRFDVAQRSKRGAVRQSSRRDVEVERKSIPGYGASPRTGNCGLEQQMNVRPVGQGDDSLSRQWTRNRSAATCWRNLSTDAARVVMAPVGHDADHVAAAGRTYEPSALDYRRERRAIVHARHLESHVGGVPTGATVASHPKSGDTHGSQTGDCGRGHEVWWPLDGRT